MFAGFFAVLRRACIQLGNDVMVEIPFELMPREDRLAHKCSNLIDRPVNTRLSCPALNEGRGKKIAVVLISMPGFIHRTGLQSP